MLGAVVTGQKEWVPNPQEHPQCQFLNQDHIGVRQLVVGLVEGTRLHQILHGDCVSLYRSPDQRS